MIMFKECITVRTVYEGNVHHLCIGKSLLHPTPNAVVIVFSFDYSQWKVMPEIKDIISIFGLCAADGSPFDKNTTWCYGHVLANVKMNIPLRSLKSRSYEFCADVTFT